MWMGAESTPPGRGYESLSTKDSLPVDKEVTVHCSIHECAENNMNRLPKYDNYIRLLTRKTTGSLFSLTSNCSGLLKSEVVRFFNPGMLRIDALADISTAYSVIFSTASGP